MVDFSNNYATDALGTDDYGDLLMVDGDLVLTSDVDPRGAHPVGQDITVRLKTFLAEVFVDTSLGVPYYQQLLGQKAPAATWDAVLQSVVLQTPGVIQLTDWQTTVDTRRRVFGVRFSAVTSLGIVTGDTNIELTGT